MTDSNSGASKLLKQIYGLNFDTKKIERCNVLIVTIAITRLNIVVVPL